MRCLAALLLLAACGRDPVSTARAPEPPARPVDAAVALPRATAPAFVGSAACLRCHGKHGPRWQASWHARALSPAAGALGRFDNVHFKDESTEAWMLEKDGRRRVRTLGPDGHEVTVAVDWLIGGKKMQDPLTVLADGRWQVLPVYWQVGRHEWVDYTEEKQGKLDPQHPFFWSNFRRTANHECLDCHATGVDTRYQDGRWATHLVEPGIGCEGCHGAGARHAETQELADIINPKKLPPDRQLALCGSCHGPRQPLFPLLDEAHRFRPGDAYDASYTALVIVDGARRSGDFFADGRPRTSSYEYQALSQSRCHLQGGATCITCHAAPHDAAFPDELAARGDDTCRGCHAPVFAAGKEHTHHARAACLDCHMPPVVTGVREHFADHALDVPVPENSARHGVPNACNACHQHERETPEQTAAALARLWPGAAARQARRLRLADAIDEATRGQSRAPLEAVLADESEAKILRGAAAILLVQRFPAAAERVVPLLGDGDALLRARAAEALAYTRAGADALAAAARDPSPSVRQAAALSLARQGDARAEEAVARLAGDPATDGLPQPHFALALLSAQRGALDVAERELLRTVELMPYHVDALVGLAGLAMQRGDRARARAVLEEALRFAPDHGEARARLDALSAQP